MRRWLAVVALCGTCTVVADPEAQNALPAPSAGDMSNGVLPETDPKTKAYVEHLQSLYANPDPGAVPESVRKMMDVVQSQAKAAALLPDSQLVPDPQSQEPARQGQGAVTVQERSQALSALGISPADTGYVTILVSSSMPLELLRAYAEQAVWVGGILDFRGINPEHDLKWFMKEVILPLVKSNHSPAVTLDPRPFSAYDVSAVPTVVYSRLPPERICTKEITKSLARDQGKPLEYRECSPIDSSQYWKISGSVTLTYALDQISTAGAPGAGLLAKAMVADPYFGHSKAAAPLSSDGYAKALGPSNLHDVLDLIQAPDPWKNPYPSTLHSLTPSQK
ncbi:MAG: TrbC family F-type conjugative pilus assembly protein [Nevskia sp.]|nr:TrbC family F-type conjugative pilus assembly protein [Nevskia sp.]